MFSWLNRVIPERFDLSRHPNPQVASRTAPGSDNFSYCLTKAKREKKMNTPINPDALSSDSIDHGQPVVGPQPAKRGQDRDRMETGLEEARKLIEQAQQLIGKSSSIELDADGAKKLRKLIIQIPCYNEAGTLGITLEALPREIPGIETVEWLVIDDGSVDSTVDVALENGVDHIVKLPRNQGLARAFMAGIEACIDLGADVIVNTDADNQYEADDIEKLVQPIVQGQADMVVGERPILETPHFSKVKKLLQKVGSWVVRQVSKADVADAPSGFRAISRDTAMRLNVFNDYTYTLETLIQTGQNGMAVTSVPIRTNADLRPSRLFKSIRAYVTRSATTIVRIFMTYRPLQFFAVPGAALCAGSIFLCFRYLCFFLAGTGGGHIQSLILASILMGAGLLSIVVGLIGDLISVNRKLMEKIDYRMQRLGQQIDAMSEEKNGARQ